jgi:predicted SprT family Zn-dependent metalloprotease
MATRYSVELEKIRVGENQTSRYGSMSRRANGKFRISISDYPTDTQDKLKNLTNKIRILETILHEFAHIVLYKEGDRKAKHGQRFVEKLHDMTITDWQEIVKIYNFLAQDNISDSFELMSGLSDDRCFSSREYAEARRRHASNENG